MCLLKQIKKKLPIGIENFAKLQSEDFYYVDKTMLIKELLDNWAEVNLFTRPRRFGKTLNMSMLKAFFELNGDILIETEDQETGIIIEIKYAETGNLEAVSEEALKQIEDRRYEEQLLEEGVEHILKYGIAFYKKKCKVMAVK